MVYFRRLQTSKYGIMEYINIDSSKHSLYSPFKNLYSISFPIFEQRTEMQQEKAFASTRYHLTGYEENNVFIGFISYWEFDGSFISSILPLTGNWEARIRKRHLAWFHPVDGKNRPVRNHPVVDEVSEARLSSIKDAVSMKIPIRILIPLIATAIMHIL